MARNSYRLDTVDYPLSRSPFLRTLTEIGDYQEIDWEASKQALDEKPIVWPFEKTSRVEAMQAIEQLINTRNDAQFRQVDGKRKSVGAVADNITASSYAALKVLQAMETEARDMVLNSYQQGIPFETRYDVMDSFVRVFDSTLAKHNNDACMYISEELADKGIPVPYLDLEESKYKHIHKLDYTGQAELTFARNAANEHYQAAEAIYKDIRAIISSGVYGDDLKTRIAERFNCTNNDTEMKRMQALVSAEAKLDIINKWIIPELQKEQVEASLNAVREERRNAELPEDQRDWYFKELKEYTDGQIEALKEVVKELREKEKEKFQHADCRVSFKYDSRSKTVDIKMSYDSELKKLLAREEAEKNKTPKLNKKGNPKIMQTSSYHEKEQDHKKQSLLVKIGVTSNALYEQTKETLFKKWGFHDERGIRFWERGVKNELDVSALTYETKSTVKTKMSDRAGVKVSGKASLFKVEDNVYFVAKEKDYKLLGLTGNLLGANGEFDKTKLIPTIKFGAFVAELEGKALNDKLKAKGTFTSLNVNTNLKTNLMKFIQGVDKDMGKTMRGEEEYKDKTLIDAVKNSAKNVVDKIIHPKFTVDPTLKVSVMDYALFEAKFNGQEVSTYNAIKKLMEHPHVQKFANEIIVPVTTMLPVAQMSQQANTAMKTACARFAANGNLVPSQIKPDAIVFAERDGQPMICRVNDLEKGDKIVIPSEYLKNPNIQNDVVTEVQELVENENGFALVTDELLISNEDFSQEYDLAMETLQHEPMHAIDQEQEKETEIEEEMTEERAPELGE